MMNHQQRETVALSCKMWWLVCCLALFTVANGADIFLDWNVALSNDINPTLVQQPVITINGEFPGPLINATTNDLIHVNVHNNMDEPLLMTWNGIQQRLNSWQDGVSGTNCPIQPGQNWTYVFMLKDQIGSFSYFPSTDFQRAGGGFGPVRINNRAVIAVPFPKPEDEFDLLIGDWYQDNFKDVRASSGIGHFNKWMLMNGKGPYNTVNNSESLTVTPGKTYRFRVTNVGNLWSFNFRIQNHPMLLVETEGTYTNQIPLESLDVHVGQSYSVLVTADQPLGDYYIVATPKFTEPSSMDAIGVLHYVDSTTQANGPLPPGPDPYDISFSMGQARSITTNMTTGAARPNPQGMFNVTNVTLSQTFHLRESFETIGGAPRFTVNNVSYITPSTPLKLADQFLNGSGVYDLDTFPTHSSLNEAVSGTFVATGIHKGWLELVFQNDLSTIDSWHLDGFGFFVVGFGQGEWTPEARNSTYNLYNPVVRSTVQVYPGGWTAAYVYLDNNGMWNLRSQNLQHWYLGQELYIRVHDPSPNPAKEKSPPDNLLYCGLIQSAPPPPPSPPSPPSPNSPPSPGVPANAPPPSAGEMASDVGWSSYYAVICTILALLM